MRWKMMSSIMTKSGCGGCNTVAWVVFKVLFFLSGLINCRGFPAAKAVVGAGILLVGISK